MVFYTVPQGIAARLGGGPAAARLVLASTSAATVVGTPLFGRFVRPRARLVWMGLLATATCATLVLTGLRPGLATSPSIFSASAAFGAYQLPANTAFVARVPDGCSSIMSAGTQDGSIDGPATTWSICLLSQPKILVIASVTGLSVTGMFSLINSQPASDSGCARQPLRREAGQRIVRRVRLRTARLRVPVAT